METNVKVAIRCRPLSLKELNRNCKSIVSGTNNSIHIEGIDNQHGPRDFAFDYCYYEDSKQQQVYSDLGHPMILKALDGYNGTIFCYGQTSSGKSYSMTGTSDDPGIIPRLNDDLWLNIMKKVETVNENDVKYLVAVSFLEIYNEDIKDLLLRSDRVLKIRESPDLGIFVEGLCELVVKDSSDILRLIEQGNAVRRVAATNMNEQSSRSHSVFIIKIERKTTSQLAGGVTRELLVKAKLNLIDLAGSERANKTGATGNTLKEGIGINSSLTALGNVINALSEGGKKHIPYRDSKLTRLLQESLGGNSATCMIATISPADYNYDETLSTLKYANRAKSIANMVTRNEDLTERVIRDLQGQIELLKQQLANNASVVNNVSTINPELETKLAEMERLKQNAWEEREKLSHMLEEERQRNMNAVIGDMMNQVKDQKRDRIKQINHLTQEKTQLVKQFADEKEKHGVLTVAINNRMKNYQSLHEEYEKIVATIPEMSEESLSKLDAVTLSNRKVTQEKSDNLAKIMTELVNDIEKDREIWSHQRENLERMKNRLTEISDLIIDQKADLVTFAGFIDQNEKFRSQIQDEEKLKAKKVLDEELAKLEMQRNQVQSNLEEEMQLRIKGLNDEIVSLKALLENEVKKSDNLNEELLEQWEYAYGLEKQLNDAERARSILQDDYNSLQSTYMKDSNELNELRLYKQQTESRNEEKASYHAKYEEIHQQVKKEFDEKLKKEQYDVYKKLMDTFMNERNELKREYDDMKLHLSQATNDLMFLSKQNMELKMLLEQSLQYEPDLSKQTLKKMTK